MGLKGSTGVSRGLKGSIGVYRAQKGSNRGLPGTYWQEEEEEK